LKAFGLFTEIINAGMDVVTLLDGRTYTAGASLGDLIFSIVDMSRAHEESRAKSHRLRAAWVNKRNNAKERKLTAKCPGWLRLSPDKKKFDVVSARAKIVTRIFEDTAAGIGLYAMARRLNEAGTPPFGRSRGWHTSSISKILAGRAVLGEFQPHRLVDGRQKAEGELIKDYFPAIIPQKLYWRAQAARNQLRLNGAGRKGSNVSNLFSGLAKCGYCGARMRFENKGSGPRGGIFLACDSARRGLGCEKTRWRYSDFEASFLAFVKELDLESLIRSETESERSVHLQNEIAALRGEVASIEEKRERAFNLFVQGSLASEFVRQKLNEIEEQLTNLVEAISQKERERDELSSELSGFYESKEQLKGLIERVQHTSGEDVYKLRAQIAARLKSLVSAVFVAPVGAAPVVRKEIELLKENYAAENADRIERLSEILVDESQSLQRYFLVSFRDGSTRGIYPKRDDPLQFEQQLLTPKEVGLVTRAPKENPTLPFVFMVGQVTSG
jgi:hypothetical protein